MGGTDSVLKRLCIPPPHTTSRNTILFLTLNRMVLFHMIVSHKFLNLLDSQFLFKEQVAFVTKRVCTDTSPTFSELEDSSVNHATSQLFYSNGAALEDHPEATTGLECNSASNDRSST